MDEQEKQTQSPELQAASLQALTRPKTQYDLKDIVLRCFDECIQAGYIREDTDKGADLGADIEIIVNRDQVADHIAKTAIGELLEFEMIRRYAPLHRARLSLERDHDYLLEQEAHHNRMLGIRIGEK